MKPYKNSTKLYKCHECERYNLCFGQVSLKTVWLKRWQGQVLGRRAVISEQVATALKALDKMGEVLKEKVLDNLT